MYNNIEIMYVPTAEFHFTSLIIEREPCDIDFTRRLKYSCGSLCDADPNEGKREERRENCMM